MNSDFLPKLWAGQRGENSRVRLTGVRAANESSNSQNSFARYDDMIFVEIDGVVTPWLASTDPAWALVVHPIVPEGAAQLCEGNHLFQLHLMHGVHLCLGQAERVHVNRLNADGTVREKRVLGDYGICIHSGGEGMQTDRFSAGCQIFQNPDGYFQDQTWSNIFDPIHRAMRTLNLATVPYVLTSRDSLQAAGLI